MCSLELPSFFSTKDFTTDIFLRTFPKFLGKVFPKTLLDASETSKHLQSNWLFVLSFLATYFQVVFYLLAYFFFWVNNAFSGNDLPRKEYSINAFSRRDNKFLNKRKAIIDQTFKLLKNKSESEKMEYNQQLSKFQMITLFILYVKGINGYPRKFTWMLEFCTYSSGVFAQGPDGKNVFHVKAIENHRVNWSNLIIATPALFQQCCLSVHKYLFKVFSWNRRLMR